MVFFADSFKILKHFTTFVLQNSWSVQYIDKKKSDKILCPSKDECKNSHRYLESMTCFLLNIHIVYNTYLLHYFVKWLTRIWRFGKKNDVVNFIGLFFNQFKRNVKNKKDFNWKEETKMYVKMIVFINLVKFTYFHSIAVCFYNEYVFRSTRKNRLSQWSECISFSPFFHLL